MHHRSGEPTLNPNTAALAEGLRGPEECAAREAALDAAHDLERACQAAGLNLSALASMRRSGEVEIGSVSPQVASELAALIRRRAKPAFQAAVKLSAALQTHDLDMTEPHVHYRKIHLGEVALGTADRLACLLGFPSQLEPAADLLAPHTVAGHPARQRLPPSHRRRLPRSGTSP